MSFDEQRRRLIDLVSANPVFMRRLGHVRSLGLVDWCIGAGALRNLVWDALHRRSVASALADVDVAYFDDADKSADRDRALVARLRAIDRETPWEVVNQAGVHRWFAEAFGHGVDPLTSLEEAVGSWPEFATSVAVTLDRDDALRVIAPHGLDDLFAMVVRRNPARVSVDAFRARTAQKRYAERWPRVRIVAAATPHREKPATTAPPGDAREARR